MFFMLSCFVVIRQIYLAITVPMTHNLLVVIAGWPLTWVLCAAGMAVYFFRADWMKNAEKLVQDNRFFIKFHKSGIQSPFLTKTRNEFMTVEDGLYMSGADCHSEREGLMSNVMKPRKAAVIGCGFVGSATAFTLMQSKLFSELVLLDVNADKADGKRRTFPMVFRLRRP